MVGVEAMVVVARMVATRAVARWVAARAVAARAAAARVVVALAAVSVVAFVNQCICCIANLRSAPSFNPAAGPSEGGDNFGSRWLQCSSV